ncbi:MAG: nitroreductase family protein [Deltaproteobacteria bacterium]|nr:nitroreductase family protein [Deltaproteobacteria bacterium]
MTFRTPVTDLIRRRYSCRKYVKEPIDDGRRRRLAKFLLASSTGPLGTRARFQLLAATEGDTSALRGLGTYGMVRDAPGFLVGAAEPGAKNLEDCGYLLERAVLAATDLGLATCWLGGTFSKSRFAERIGLAPGESMPAVAAVGIAAEGSRSGWVRRQAGSDSRLPPGRLFFDGELGTPITPERAGPYGEPLEMVRWAPSASNKQPWRVLRRGATWDFYLQRTKGYGRGTLAFKLLGLADLQRVDLGIAMCHFELAARQLGLKGGWTVRKPQPREPNEGTEYTVTWEAAD